MKFKNLKKDIEIWLGTQEPPHDNCMWLKQSPDGNAVPMLMDEESGSWQVSPYFGITSPKIYKCYDDMRGNTYKLSTGKFVKAEDLELALADLENLNLGLSINQYVEDNSQPGFRQLKDYPFASYGVILGKAGLWNEVTEDIYCFGGVSANKRAYKYNIANDSFTAIADLTYQVRTGYTAYKNGNIYILLGNLDPDRAKTTLKYNVSAGTYSTIPAQSTNTSTGGDSIQLDDVSAYILGGGQSKLLQFNLSTETWTENLAGVSENDLVNITPIPNSSTKIFSVIANNSGISGKTLELSTGAFTTLEIPKYYIRSVARALFGNKSYFVGGWDSANKAYTDRVVSYNHDTSEWKLEELTSLLAFNANPGIQNGGSLYIPTCESNNASQKIFQVFTVQPNIFEIPAPQTVVNSSTLAPALDLVYKFGGRVGSDAMTPLIECFNPITKTWSYKQSMQSGRRSMSSAYADSDIYLIGGLTSATDDYSITDQVQKYDALNDVFSTLQAIPKAMFYSAAVCCKGLVYNIAGRVSASEVLSENYCYDPATETWTTKQPLPISTSYCQAQEIDGKIYLFGGDNGENARNTTYQYNPESDLWTTKANMAYASMLIASAKINDLIVAIGWILSGGTKTAQTQIYNPRTDEWNIWSSLSQAFNDEYAACAANGSIYVVGATAHEALGPILNPVAWSPTHYVEGNAIGDYLLDDGRILAANAYDEEEFKDHIAGIVIVPKSGDSELIAMALDELSGAGTDYYFSNQQKLLLGQEIEVNTSSSVKQPPISGSNPLLTLSQYKNSNAALREAVEDGGVYPAYSYCKAYAAPGYAAGSWYLPNINYLNLMYTNRTVLNQSLNKIGKTPLRTDDSFYWSCIQKNNLAEWVVYFGSNYSSYEFVGTLNKNQTGSRYCTRPIIGVNGTGGGTDEPLPNSSVDPLLGELGDYLLSDGTVLPGASYEEKYKSAIAGVIVIKKTASKEGIALALTQLDGTGANYYFSSEIVEVPNQTTIAWQEPNGYTYAIKPTDIASNNLLLAEAAQDYKKDNAAIKARRDSGSATYPAYTYCANHSAPGYPAGSWYLPSMKILYDMWLNRTALNQALSRIGATQLEPGGTHAWYWSCVQQRADIEWRVYFGSDYSYNYFFSYYYKDHTGGRYVSRPIVGF